MRRNFLLFLLFLILIISSLACKAITGAFELAPVVQSNAPQTLSIFDAHQSPTDVELDIPSAISSPIILPSLTPTLLPTLTQTDTPQPTTNPSSTTAPIHVTASPLQTAIFDELWRTVNDYYLYPDFNGLDWDSIYSEYLQKIEAGLTDEAFYQALSEMIERLGDNHSTFLSPKQADEEDTAAAGGSQYVGIGIVPEPLPEQKKATVLIVFPGSPAEIAGIKAHDSILAVNGQPIFDESGAHIDQLRGPEGSQVSVTVQSPGQQPRDLNILRQRTGGAFPVPYQLLTTASGKRIGYIFLIDFFDRNIGPGFQQALQVMTTGGPLDGLIIDNRYNSGGTTEVVLSVLDYLANGPVGNFYWRGQNTPLVAAGKDTNGSQTTPLVVLVGKGSVSYGEIVSGVLRDIGRAYLVGEQTDGNVEVLTPYEFSDGSRAWIATQTFRPLNNPNLDWEQTGIVPDLNITSNWEQVTTETDPVILAALQYFNNLPASVSTTSTP